MSAPSIIPKQMLNLRPILAESWLIPLFVLAVVTYRQVIRVWVNRQTLIKSVTSGRIHDRSSCTADRRKEHRDEEDEGSRRNTEEEQAGRQYIRTFPDLSKVSVVSSAEGKQQLRSDKELYWKLQNLEDHYDALPLARIRLAQLFDHTLTLCHALGEPILNITSYSPSAVQALLAAAHASSATKYEAYLHRRRTGGPRELYPTKEHAKEWLRLAAVVKYVDGGWISSIMNQVCGTAFHEDETRRRSTSRQAGKMAWQVISEEFGDGDLEKNHIFMYHTLMDQLGVGARDEQGRAVPGHIPGFDGLKPDQGIERCWTAALAQQCIGALSTEYFAEALGFNMAYECLPYHLLVTSKELRELGIDDTYFALHITIDNPDSGHAALARLAVERYLEGVKVDLGEEAMQKAWRRVQAGFLLAEGLPTTPWSPIEFEQIPNSTSWRASIPSSTAIATGLSPTSRQAEEEMAKLMRRKAAAAEKMHCPSRMLINKRTLEEWLDPKTLSEDKAIEFVRAMAETRVMIRKGDVAGSRLVKELEWGGRMFGAFSRGEVNVVRRWIMSQGEEEPSGIQHVSYESFTGHATRHDTVTPLGSSPNTHSLAKSFSSISIITMAELLARPIPILSTPINFSRLIPLWLTSLTLLEMFPLSPTKLSTPLGMSIIRLIRSQQGFAPLYQPADICAGLDDFGLEVQHDVQGLWEVAQFFTGQKGDLVLSVVLEETDEDTRRTCEGLLALRNRPYTHQAELLGLTLGFARALHSQEEVKILLRHEERRDLEEMVKRIADEEVEAVVECIEHRCSARNLEVGKSDEYWQMFVKGYLWALDAVQSN